MLTTEQIDEIRDSFAGLDAIPSRATVQRIATLASPMLAASAAPAEGREVHAELIAKIEEYGGLRDNIGRSRQANNYAANESAVKRSVDLKFEIDAMLRAALATAPTMSEASAITDGTLSVIVKEARRAGNYQEAFERVKRKVTRLADIERIDRASTVK